MIAFLPSWDEEETKRWPRNAYKAGREDRQRRQSFETTKKRRWRRLAEEWEKTIVIIIWFWRSIRPLQKTIEENDEAAEREEMTVTTIRNDELNDILIWSRRRRDSQPIWKRYDEKRYDGKRYDGNEAIGKRRNDRKNYSMQRGKSTTTTMTTRYGEKRHPEKDWSEWRKRQ